MSATAAERRSRQPELVAFLARQQRRAANRVDLAAALLSNAGLRYLVLRGWILFARLPLRVGLHAAEVVVLSDFLELGVLGYLLALRSAAATLGALHWGALEPFRQSVRRESARGNRAGIALEIARNLRFALDYCLVLLAILVVGLQLGPRPFESFSIVDAYAIGCGLRAMTEVITRTYHAGAFALRRVYRPLGATLAVDLVDVGTTLVLWPWLGAWGFAVAQVLGGAVEAALTLVYTRRAYDALNLEAPSWRLVLSDRAKPLAGTWRRRVLPALGNAVAQLDALLITALSFSVSESGAAFAAGLHVLRPVLSLSGNWARLFYFDLSRLQSPLRRLFRERLERVLLRAAPLFGGLTAAGALSIGAIFEAGGALWQVLWFVPFLVARSLYALTQVQAFARGRFGALLTGAAIVGALLVFINRASAAPGMLVALVTAALLAASGAFRWMTSLSRREGDDDGYGRDRLLRPLAFFGELARMERAFQLSVLVVPPRLGRASGVARAIAGLPSTLWVTRIARRRLLVAGEGMTVASLIAASGGSLASVTSLSPTDGAHARRLLLEQRLLGTSFLQTAASEAELRRDFAARFPSGKVLTGDAGALAAGTVSPGVLTATLAELTLLASGAWLTRRRGLRAAVYAPGGEARLIFLASPADDAASFAAFERAVFQASVEHSVSA